jgi:hypothetical protein
MSQKLRECVTSEKSGVFTIENHKILYAWVKILLKLCILLVASQLRYAILTQRLLQRRTHSAYKNPGWFVSLPFKHLSDDICQMSSGPHVPVQMSVERDLYKMHSTSVECSEPAQ